MSAKAYGLLRTTHLYAGLLLIPSVFIYFATGVLMLHGAMFPNPGPEVVVREEALSYDGPPTGDDLAIHLRAEYDLQGRSYFWNPDEGGQRFTFRRPGLATTADVSPDGSSVTITETRSSWIDTLDELHSLKDYWGGSLYALWALFLDLTSLAMIVFGATGVYMCFTLSRRRRLVWGLLIGSWAFTTSMILYLYLAP